MNLRQLNEAGGEGVTNFADQAEQTLGKVGQLAKTAFNRFQASKARAKADIKKAENDEAAAKAKSDKDKAAAVKTQLSMKAGPKAAPVTVAGIVLDFAALDDPEGVGIDPAALSELDDLDAEHFAYIQNALDDVQARFGRLEKIFPKLIKSATFVPHSATERDISDRLYDHTPKNLASARKLLADDAFGERSAWMSALLDDDQANTVAKAMHGVVGRMFTEFERRNQGQAKKVWPMGMNILIYIGGQRQIIEERLQQLRIALGKLSQKTVSDGQVSEALLKRVRRLSKRL
jgi:hypothetical protein